MEASDWDKIFDELYLQTYVHLADPEQAPREAEGLVRLVGLEPGVDLLDCPCGYGRHSIEFARLGLHVVGADWSEVLSSPKRGAAAATPSGRGGSRPTTASFRSRTRASTAWPTCSRRSATGVRRATGGADGVPARAAAGRDTRDRDDAPRPADGDLRPRSLGRTPGRRAADRGAEIDYERGTTRVRHELVEPDGHERTRAHYEIRVYTATELIAWSGRRLRAGRVPRRLRRHAAVARHAARPRRELGLEPPLLSAELARDREVDVEAALEVGEARPTPRSRAGPRRRGRTGRWGSPRPRSARNRPRTACPRPPARRRGGGRARRTDRPRRARRRRGRTGRAVGAEVGVAAAGCRQDLRELALDVARRLAGERAPLGEQAAALGVARQLLAALDHRGVGGARCRAAGGRGAAASAAVELLEPVSTRPMPDDRVDARVGPRPVRGDARDVSTSKPTEARWATPA